MHPCPCENADVITTAPPLESFPAGADLETTWTGAEDRPEPDGTSERLSALELLLEKAQRREREQRARADAAETAARLHAEAQKGALAGLEEARSRIADLEAAVAAERERAAACILRGLDAVPIEELLAAVHRRVVASVSAALKRAVPAAAIVIARHDAGDDARQNASKRL
ncbi:hypothetical protein [Sorangium sp. So ce233]|uniref:hypothetical protein n=1 Tax=Sorangium sp. So ce233 TaxID=3133290 RepID=UPI003F5F6212